MVRPNSIDYYRHDFNDTPVYKELVLEKHRLKIEDHRISFLNNTDLSASTIYFPSDRYHRLSREVTQQKKIKVWQNRILTGLFFAVVIAGIVAVVLFQ